MLTGQLDTAAYYLPGVANPTNYRADFRVKDNGLITSAQVQGPSGVMYPLGQFSGGGGVNGSWDFFYSYNSLEQRNAAFPNGAYTLTVNSILGTTTTQFSYTSTTALTPNPTLIGISDGAMVSPTPARVFPF